MPRLKHLTDNRGANGEIAVKRAVAGDEDLVARVEPHRCRQLAHSELRALEIGDQRDRPTELLVRGPDHPRVLGVLLLRSVREVEASAVHARSGEPGDELLRRGCRPKGRHDLRAAGQR